MRSSPSSDWGNASCVKLDSHDALILQPKMAGLVLVGIPPNQAHARLVLELDRASASPIIYWDQRGLGNVRLWTSQELSEYIGSGSLGPDALSIAFEDFYRRLSSSKREVKTDFARPVEGGRDREISMLRDTASLPRPSMHSSRPDQPNYLAQNPHRDDRYIARSHSL